ncbi:unnamed protein product [Euphydryas editha]|uniref:Uncharacterized protein n=1 Tax=Euphydryas editha TaxID=104508 RepID=A0AAU9TL32_EUPED|nr:unnamed protein product [Euphydryas editha]
MDQRIFARTSLLSRKFFTKNNTVTMPPYLPSMAPCDFLKITSTLKGRRFTGKGDIKIASLEELKAMPNSEFEKFCKDWKKLWCVYKCIISNGDYFEGENINVDNFFFAKTIIFFIF